MGKQWKQCQTLYFAAPKSLQMVIAAMKLKDTYSLEGKLANLDGVLKSRDITLPRKVRLIKAMVFPVVMYGCESWTVKKAERRRIDAFELWCWRRLLRVPWTERRANQPTLKEINAEYSLEGLMLKLLLLSHFSRVRLFATPMHTMLPCPSPTPRACSNSGPSSRWCHPTISYCCPVLLLSSIFPSIRIFSNESVQRIRWPKYWSFNFSISPSNEQSGLIPFRLDGFDLLSVQGTLKSLLQHPVQKHQFYGVQLSL